MEVVELKPKIVKIYEEVHPSLKLVLGRMIVSELNDIWILDYHSSNGNYSSVSYYGTFTEVECVVPVMAKVHGWASYRQLHP